MKMDARCKPWLCVEQSGSDNPTRDVLRNLHLRPNMPTGQDTPVLEATDGKMYVAIPVEFEQGDISEGLIPAVHISTPPFSAEPRDERTIKVTAEHCELECGTVFTRPPEPGRAYPGTNHLFEDAKYATIEVGLDAQRLATLQQAMGSPFVKICLTPGNPWAAILVKPAGHEAPEPDAVGLLMPARL